MKSIANEKIRFLFYKADPFTYLIRGKLNFSPGKTTFFITLVLNLPVIGFAFIYDVWVGGNGITGLLHDYGWWAYQIIGVPSILYFFLWMPDIVFNVLVGLRENKVVGTGRNDGQKYNTFIIRFAKSYSGWIWLWIATFIVALFMFFAVIPEHRLFISWQTANTVIFIYHEMFWFLIFLLGGMAIVKTMLSIYWFNVLFKEFQADVRVLHPDGAGGLSPLGNFSVKIGYMIGILGLLVIIVIWSQSTYLLADENFSLLVNPAIITLTFAYVILAPVVFFAPIGSAHSAMKKAKADFIIAISDQFESDFSKLQGLLNNDGIKLKNALDKIGHLHKIHDMVSRFPIWPFNTASLIRFFSSVFSPIVLSVIPSLIIEFWFAK